MSFFSRQKFNPYFLLNSSYTFYIGAISLGLTFYLSNESLHYISATHVSILETLSPLFVILLGWFGLLVMPRKFKHLIKRKKIPQFIIVVLISSLGVVLLVFGSDVIALLFGNNKVINNNPNKLQGYFSALLAPISLGVFLLMNSEVRKSSSASSLQITIGFLSCAGITLLIFALPFIDPNNFLMLTVRQWMLLFVVILFPTALAYWLWNYAASYLGVTSLSLLHSLILVFAALCEYFFMTLTLNWQLLVSVCLIIPASWYAERLNT